MATGSKKFQAPKGTRDFYPQDMAVRRYIEGVWRRTSINHGFDEIEGPMFEDLELYMHKSGPGIVSELFQVYSGKDKAEIEQIQKTGQAPFALRPEFTPTLARMVAAKAAELPRPIKWFAIPQHFRAERPQRGRLREFLQWNVDFIDESRVREAPLKGEDVRPQPWKSADAEVIAVCISALQAFGLTSNDVLVYHSDRALIQFILQRIGVPDEKLSGFSDLLDKRARLTHTEAWHALGAMGLPVDMFDRFDEVAAQIDREVDRHRDELNPTTEEELDNDYLLSIAMYGFGNIRQLKHNMKQLGLEDWCKTDHSIVRGLAYYTTTVFEVHERTGAERAIAGGGSYDNLIASFGGPSLPACGFGMGDVVLGNLLHDKGLLPEEVYMKPLRPHAFAIAANDEAEPKMRQTVAALRRDGFHVRHSYKTTRNVGKLLGDASKSRAMTAIIFGSDAAPPANRVDLKDLDGQSQETIAISEIASKLKDVIRRNDESK